MISASGAEPLPTNGDKWHEIRQGKLPSIPQVLSQEFLSLLKVSSRTQLTGTDRFAVVKLESNNVVNHPDS